MDIYIYIERERNRTNIQTNNKQTSKPAYKQTMNKSIAI